MKKIVLFLFFSFFLFSCNNSNLKDVPSKDEQTKKLDIVTSIVPLASITNYIGGDYVNVDSLIPAGVSPHGYDIKTSQMKDIENADLIVNLGLDHIDGFLDKVIEDKKNVISVKQGIELLESSGHDDHEHEDEHNDEHNDELEEELHENEEHHEKESHEDDPHIWTSAENAITIAQSIENKLIELNPENKDYFESNFSLFKNELENIKNNFITDFSKKNQQKFIVFHDAYNYLFEELGIEEQNKLVFQSSVLSDSSSKDLKNLIDDVKSYSVKIAFREPQLNDVNLQKFAIEYNLGVYVLDPLGSDTSKNGYIENYKKNLESLKYIYE